MEQRKVVKKNGELFVYEGREYIKVNCYCIIKGNYGYLYDDAKVRVVKEMF